MGALRKTHVWVTFVGFDENTYVITSDERDRSMYYLYIKHSEKDYEKIAQNSNPLKLNDIVMGNKQQSMNTKVKAVSLF